MSLREPHIAQISHHRFAWVARVPWLPQSSTEDADYVVQELHDGYHSICQAMAGVAPWEAAVQFRLFSKGSTGPDMKPDLLWAVVVGAARSRSDAARLWQLLSATRPFHLPLEPGGQDAVEGTLGWVRPDRDAEIVEIRRSLEEARPLPGADPLDDAGERVVRRWDVSDDRLRRVLSLIGEQPQRTMLVLHAARARLTPELFLALSNTFHSATESLRGQTGDDYAPYVRRIAEESRQRMEHLRRGALDVRVSLASVGPLFPGTAQAIGLALSSDGSFDVRSPSRTDEAHAAWALVTDVEGRPWGETGDPQVDDLIHIADPAEAAAVVRFPTVPPGGLPCIPTRAASTLPRSPQPSPSGRRSSGQLQLGAAPGGGQVSLTLRELNQHLLVAGLPGSGKSNTVRGILTDLWNEHEVPFLVLDPAKRDYPPMLAALTTRPDRMPMHIRLSPDSVAFNPFATPSGTSAASHAARVLGALDSALQISANWPFGYLTLAKGVFQAYEDCPDGQHPTLRSVYAAVGDVIRATPMDQEAKSNVTGGLLGRLEAMVRGPLGSSMLGASDAGIDWEALLERPTLIEFGGFPGPTERSLVFGLLIAGLTSFREGSTQDTDQGLAHVTVLEEAHRVLSDRGAAESEGVRLLAEAIAELRGSGEGFTVVDQTPTALHPVIRKIAGSVIAHRLVDEEERQAVGAALLLDERQSKDLARLPVGRAVVYGAERVAPAVVDVKEAAPAPGPALPVLPSLSSGRIEPLFCVGCTSMCLHRADGSQLAANVAAAGGDAAALLTEEMLDQHHPNLIWCGIAHQLGHEAAADSASSVFRQLREHRTRLVTLVRQHERKVPSDASTARQAPGPPGAPGD